LNEQLGYLLANAAVEPDGIELDFQGDKCGNSYRIKRNCIKTWEVYYNDWHEGGWYELRGYGGSSFTRHEAIEICNKHALEKRLINWLPNRPKYKPSTWAQGLAGAATGLGSLFGVFGL
jgi:hypothetical protein